MSGPCVADRLLVLENPAKAGQSGLDRMSKIFAAHLARLMDDLFDFSVCQRLEIGVRVHNFSFHVI
jgi:hypothetical protein